LFTDGLFKVVKSDKTNKTKWEQYKYNFSLYNFFILWANGNLPKFRITVFAATPLNAAFCNCRLRDAAQIKHLWTAHTLAITPESLVVRAVLFLITEQEFANASER